MTAMSQPPAEGGRRTTPRRRRAGPVVVVLVTAGALAVACGGRGSPDAASASPNATSAQSPARQSGLLFASCIRAHGIPNLPDSAVSVIGGQLQLHIPGYLKPQFPSAFQACQRDLPPGDIPARKRFNIQEELNFASCMRSHGITDFPDPLPGGGWHINLANTNSPQFEAAAHACQATGIHWNGPPSAPPNSGHAP
jgi:hypothetical protein